MKNLNIIQSILWTLLLALLILAEIEIVKKVGFLCSFPMPLIIVPFIAVYIMEAKTMIKENFNK